MTKTKNELEQFIAFFQSGLSELEFFSIVGFDKGNLVLLRDYLKEIENKKATYLEKIADPISEIIKRNKWVTSITSMNSKKLHISTNTPPSFELEKSDNSDYFHRALFVYPYSEKEHISTETFMNLLIGIKLGLRQKIKSNSRSELLKISEITEEIFGELQVAVSVSRNFNIENYYSNSILKYKYFPLMRITNGESCVPYHNRGNVEYSFDRTVEEEMDFENEKGKLLDKMYIKR